MKNKTVLAAGLVAAALAAIPLVAQQHRAFGRHGAFGAHMLDRVATALSLTDVQKSAAEQLMVNGKAEAEPVLARMKQNRQDLAAAVKANNTAAISDLTAQQRQLAGQLAGIRAKGLAAFYAQLTPDQKAKADQFRERRMSMLQNWQGRHTGDKAAAQQ